jgi:secreted trypsin-like serine protease
LQTAAHCVSSADRKFPTVHIGRQFLSSASETGYDVRRVTTTAIHGSYDAATSANDIALLLLDAPSTKTPLPVPQYALALVGGTPVVAIGFGTTAEGSAYLSGAWGGWEMGVHSNKLS